MSGIVARRSGRSSWKRDRVATERRAFGRVSVESGRATCRPCASGVTTTTNARPGRPGSRASRCGASCTSRRRGPVSWPHPADTTSTSPTPPPEPRLRQLPYTPQVRRAAPWSSSLWAPDDAAVLAGHLGGDGDGPVEHGVLGDGLGGDASRHRLGPAVAATGEDGLRAGWPAAGGRRRWRTSPGSAAGRGRPRAGTSSRGPRA